MNTRIEFHTGLHILGAPEERSITRNAKSPFFNGMAHIRFRSKVKEIHPAIQSAEVDMCPLSEATEH